MQEEEDTNLSNATDRHRSEEHAPASTGRSTSLGKYRLIARLGHGGMAEVYLAVAQGAMNVNRLVVVKRLRDEQSEDESARDMFLNEARLAARLAHPNVVQTFEAGTEAHSYYLAMEYVDGQPMSRVLTALKRAGRVMDPKLAARICADALQGLHYAHEVTDFDGSPLEIVHRDVSPQNIMLTYDGAVKIVDFGIAKAAGTAATEHGVFKGKVAFMAPEQLLGGGVDRRVDVFAAGIVLWEAVTGQHLMADETPAKTLYNLINKRIPRASEIRPEIPAALDDVLAKALERDVERRYASAREMRDALEAFIASAGGVRAEQVGELVAGFFAETRAKVQKEIKAQLAALSLGRKDIGHSLSSGTHVRAPSATLIDLSDATAIRTASTSGQAFRMLTSAEIVVPRPSRTKRIAFVVWVAVTIAAVGVSGLALSRSQRASSAPPAAPVLGLVAPPAAAPAMVAPAIVATPVPLAPPVVDRAAAPATGIAATSIAVAPVIAPPAPPPPVWRPAPSRPAAPAAAAAPAQGPAEVRVAPSPPSTSTTKPAETATGRTFRRDL